MSSCFEPFFGSAPLGATLPSQPRWQAGVLGRTRDTYARSGTQVRRTFQKSGKPSGMPVMSGRHAAGICARPSGQYGTFSNA